MSATLFPCISRSYIEQCRFSSWYATFSRVSPRATVIRPLNAAFRGYLEEDGVIVPEGSEDFPVASTLSDESDSDEDHDASPKRHAFPELDVQIRGTIARYEAVFPKLNWSSPKDASWILPTLKCTSPAEVYLVLKSSDFISHDLDPMLAFEGCTPCPDNSASSSTMSDNAPPLHELELVLKKWYSIDPAREFRCFVRDETLLGIAQRDPNYYPHLNEQDTKDKITSSVSEFWTQNIRTKFGGGRDYVFDVHMTRDLSSAHLLDINPYHPKTDPLLFTYEELVQLLISTPTRVSDVTPASSFSVITDTFLAPELRVITSPSDPAATQNAPANQHNAIPFDALQMSTGNDISAFSSLWGKELELALDDTDGESSSSSEQPKCQ